MARRREAPLGALLSTSGGIPAGPEETVTAARRRPAEDLVGPRSRWQCLEHHLEVGSTNEVAADLARAGETAGMVVVADHQTRGKGRLGRDWKDEPGRSLLFSALVEDRFPRPTLVPLAAGLAVAEAVGATGAQTSLKWPNDILVDERKCAGILVEQVDGRIVIGIGVNVDWRDVETRAEDWGSVAEAVGRDVDRWRLLQTVLVALDRLLGMAESDPPDLLVRYRDACDTLGREVTIETHEGVLAGVAEDVDEDGALVLRTGDRSVCLHAGDVVHVRRLD
jgi:BirA family transcriptional regulator, biotin operon repressor / biotin---[acetyl-CoA-carboxylase] ligase